MTWAEVKLGEVADYIRGITFKPDDKVPFRSAGSVGCMRTANVQEDLDESDVIAIPREFVKRDEQFLREGDVLISSANSWNLVGKCSWVPELGYEATAGGFISILRRKNDTIDKRYLYNWLASGKIQHLARLCARQTTNIANLSTEPFLNLKIPLPPLKEQQRIAAILDKADAIRRKREQAIQLADDFLRAVFLDMFGDPVTNPKGWEVRKLGAISNSQLGKMLDKKRETGKYDKKYLRNTNVQWKKFDLNDLQEMDFPPEQQERYGLTSGDVLVCEGGDVGRCAIWKDRGIEMYYQKALHRVRLDQSTILPEYFVEVMQVFSEKGELLSSTSVATIAHLTGVKLKELELPLPPIELQQNYVDLMSKNQSIITKQNEMNTDLIDSLSQRAFKGDL